MQFVNQTPQISFQVVRKIHQTAKTVRLLLSGETTGSAICALKINFEKVNFIPYC